MNSGFRPIPSTMPVDAAAELMVRRGECRNFHAARARVLRQRRPCYGRTVVSADPALAAVEPPERRIRLPYAD